MADSAANQPSPSPVPCTTQGVLDQAMKNEKVTEGPGQNHPHCLTPCSPRARPVSLYCRKEPVAAKQCLSFCSYCA